MPRIDIDILPQAYDELWAYIDAVDTEIGGIGYAFIDKDTGRITWTDTLLVPQEVSNSGVEFTDRFYLIEQAKRDNVLGREDFAWVWWHSHGHLGVFWSETDDKDGVDAFRKAGAPALISFVGNRDHKYKARVDVFKVPILNAVKHEDVTVKLVRDSKVDAYAAEQIKHFVKEAPKPEVNVKWTGGNPAELDTTRPKMTNTELDKECRMLFGTPFYSLDDKQKETLYAWINWSNEQKKQLPPAGEPPPDSADWSAEDVVAWAGDGDEPPIEVNGQYYICANNGELLECDADGNLLEEASA